MNRLSGFNPHHHHHSHHVSSDSSCGGNCRNLTKSRRNPSYCSSNRRRHTSTAPLPLCSEHRSLLNKMSSKISNDKHYNNHHYSPAATTAAAATSSCRSCIKPQFHGREEKNAAGFNAKRRNNSYSSTSKNCRECGGGISEKYYDSTSGFSDNSMTTDHNNYYECDKNKSYPRNYGPSYNNNKNQHCACLQESASSKKKYHSCLKQRNNYNSSRKSSNELPVDLTRGQIKIKHEEFEEDDTYNQHKHICCNECKHHDHQILFSEDDYDEDSDQGQMCQCCNSCVHYS